MRANLSGANLSKIDLSGANLSGANLSGTNLPLEFLGTKVSHQQIKSACFWEKALYKAQYNYQKETWEVIEPNNIKLIENLKKDTSSDSKEPPDCKRIWNN